MLVSQRAHKLAALILSSGNAACASPSMWISTGLQRYGLDSARADCVGNHLEASLEVVKATAVCGVLTGPSTIVQS